MVGVSMMIVTAPIILYCSKSVENKEIQIVESADAVTSVSYTHLTLPTILLV